MAWNYLAVSDAYSDFRALDLDHDGKLRQTGLQVKLIFVDFVIRLSFFPPSIVPGTIKRHFPIQFSKTSHLE